MTTKAINKSRTKLFDIICPHCGRVFSAYLQVNIIERILCYYCDGEIKSTPPHGD